MKKFFSFAIVCACLLFGIFGLSACGNKARYSVTCGDCENGYVIVADSKACAGEKVILAAHPDAGYKLTSFTVDGEELDGVSFVMPGKDVTVSAMFEAITYLVTYVLGDAEFTGNNPDSYTVESAVELQSPQKEGYEICGWYTYCTQPEYGFYGWDQEDFRVTTLVGLVGNVTLYAKYYNPPHEIHVEGSGDGMCYVDDDAWEFYYGDTVYLAVIPDNFYELDYITVNEVAIDGISFTMPAADAYVAAYFKPIRYTITYELDGGTNSPDNPDYYTVEDWNMQLGDAEKDGYYFYGWYYDEAHTDPVNFEYLVYDCRSVKVYAWFMPIEEE